jgi:hypothetical protein
MPAAYQQPHVHGSQAPAAIVVCGNPVQDHRSSSASEGEDQDEPVAGADRVAAP